MVKLRAGKGAKATILTRCIKPKQALPDGDEKHRSEVILVDVFKNEKGKDCFSFRWLESSEEDILMHASTRYVKVVAEGTIEDIFDDLGEGEDGKIKWKDSKARRLLLMDETDGIISDTLTMEEIYIMRPEYAMYDFKKFPKRCLKIKEIVKLMNSRVDRDKEAYEKFVSNHPVSLFSWKGYIQWQGSESQRFAKRDIKHKLHEELGFRGLFDKRKQYFEEFSFDVWSDKYRQEINTGKYLHTLDVKGKLHKSS